MSTSRKISEIAGELVSNGYVLLRRYLPCMRTDVALTKIGEIEAVDGLAVIQQLTPKKLLEATPNTYSGNFGMGEFPLHTDLAHWAKPPRYLALRCVKGRADVATLLYDGNTLIGELGINPLRMTVVQPRRPMKEEMPLLRLVERVEEVDVLRIRWDSIYIRPSTPISEKTFQRVIHFLSNVKPIEVVLLQPGDTLIIDNWRMLHGRSIVSIDANDRRVDRAYMRLIA
ncbi:TauD/TfdA family dioxygenase [Herbaspirillum huttiense]|uniref:TauD/TfdA family dioxygenase n=1 Tax=Herbaspirillum huttiense TaxID=863372 RepID=UPI0035C75F02